MRAMNVVRSAALTLVAILITATTLYAADPGSSTAHALDLLASWAATQEVDTAAQSI